MVVCLAALLAYWVCDPMQSSWMPSCPFYSLTGWQCPFCGTQRMAHALLCGRLAEAWRHNALMLLSVPLWLTLLVAYLFRHSRPSLYARLLSARAAGLYLAVAVLWAVVRNVC